MLQTQYKPEDFFYELPEKLIAHYPTEQRTDSRLLCLNKTTGVMQHKKFKDILDFINPGDLLVLNNTQVIPARLFAKKITGGKVEILIERILERQRILAQLKSSKSLQRGTRLILENEMHVEIVNRTETMYELVFLIEPNLSILELLNQIGHIPLPPYIQRADELFDGERYQTVFASVPGAIAAPTAGLHFDEDLVTELKTKGVHIAYITLHVGSGTFQPIRSDRLEDHRMHHEYVTVSKTVCEQIIRAKQLNKRIIAVGTTVVRSLETAALQGQINPLAGETNLFIYPGFNFHCIDALITNFHLPRSTLLMLVCALGGYELIMQAYQEAIFQGYRFFSYGDAMWIS
ncbi:tRNA preQ1(34) S-adenosylmethionine ribosyltransferase-isomerase QueA [Rickettsiella grylli]|uniref:tRNA preQ1(34) S-adenosylmethionine ribosyltransferase-isomerase QueA n=1 Tax=Rickettsiella grylli TaxID=59196 RepID=UPI0008FD17E0|nr:tRNA preQ1(34) S-adenosylmethionine ribosyltransferase-isomerase QueA [Rickettsiella grylli]OIZ99905.1 tRNA preQ1(34) S-adenosylmethionine ribosyltransferase-isomerase QueA [Rickettsiella grylli]